MISCIFQKKQYIFLSFFKNKVELLSKNMNVLNNEKCCEYKVSIHVKQ